MTETVRDPRTAYLNPDRLESDDPMWKSVAGEMRLRSKKLAPDFSRLLTSAFEPTESMGPQQPMAPYTQEAAVRQRAIKQRNINAALQLGMGTSSKDIQLLGELTDEELTSLSEAYEWSERIRIQRERNQLSIDRRTEEILSRQERSRDFWRGFENVTGFGPEELDPEAAREKAMRELGFTPDVENTETSSDSYATWRIPGVYEGMQAVGDGLWNATKWVVHNFLEGSEGTVKWLMDVSGWDWLMEKTDTLWMGHLVDEVPADIPQFVLENATTRNVDLLVQQMQVDAPEVWAEYLDMADGDEIRAMGFIGFDLGQAPEDGQDQISQIQEYVEQDWIERLDRSNWSFGRELLDGMAVLGKVPMGAATWATMLLTDEDMLELTTSGEFVQIMGEVEKNDYSPAKVLGVDGTALGLATDLTMGVIFDPATWIFGPGGRAATYIDDVSKLRAVTGTTAYAKHIDDVVDAMVRGDATYLGLALGDLDDIGMLDQVLTMANDAGKITDDASRAAFRDEINKVLTRATELGVNPIPNASRQARLADLAASFDETTKAHDVVRAVREHTRPYTVSRYVPVNQPGGFTALMDQVSMLFGRKGAESLRAKYTKKLFDARQRAAQARVRLAAADSEIQDHYAIQAFRDSEEKLAQLRAQRAQLQSLEMVDDAAREVGEVSPELAAIHEQIVQQEAIVAAARKQAAEDSDTILRNKFEGFEGSSSQDAYALEVQQILDEMYADFNREFIVPKWTQKRLNQPGLQLTDDGLVPWEAIAGDKVPAKVGREAKNALDEPMTVGRKIPADDETRNNIDVILSDDRNLVPVMTPASPLEMIAAASVSGNAYRRVMQANGIGRGAAYGFIRGMEGLNALWRVDKVMSLATAATVSFDELMRIGSRWGWGNARSWFHDRLISAQSRVTAALTRDGAKLSAKQRERMMRWNEMPNQARRADVTLFDQATQQFQVIKRGDPNYRNQARAMYGTLLDDPVIRSYFTGELEDFFYSAQGDYLRNASSTLRFGGVGKAPTPAEVRTGLDHFFNALWTNVPRSQQNRIRKYLTEVSQNWKSGAPWGMPDDIAADIGLVLGSSTGASKGLRHLKDMFFDRFFNDPTIYRRGFINAAVRETEARRLTSLYKSQGYKVVTNVEAERILRKAGYSGRYLDNMGHSTLNRVLLDNKVVSERMMETLIERKVLEEIDNMMYVWQHSSRFGQYSQTLAPFGKPWADMIGFWGRESVQKPALRGWLQNTNIPGIKQAGQMAAMMPLNPRPIQMISRLMNTDFNIDRGWLGTEDGEKQGLLPGSESTDLSRILFLPTKGENPLAAMAPGLGYIPLGMLEAIVAISTETELEEEQLRETLGEFLYGFDFANTTTPYAFLMGSGNLAKGIDAAEAGILWGTGNNEAFLPTLQVNPYRATEILRATSAALVQPEGIDELMKIESDATLAVAIEALVAESAEQVGREYFFKRVADWALPFRSDFTRSTDDLYDVWAQAGKMFDRLDVDPNFNLGDPSNTSEDVYDYGNRVRIFWYNELSDWEQDLYIAKYPQLAVNLVGNWEWSERGKDRLGDETHQPYFTGNDPTAKAKHEQYIEEGYIRPRNGTDRVYQVLGRITSAIENTTKNVYSMVINEFNQWQWEAFVSDETKAKLEGFVADPTMNPYGVESAYELWIKWGTLEDVMEETLRAGVAGEGDWEQDKLKEIINEFTAIPTKEIPGIGRLGKAWSDGWPGWADGPRQDFLQLPGIGDFVNDDAYRIIETMGWDFDDAMTGQALWDTLNYSRQDEEGSVWSYIAAKNTSDTLGRVGARTGSINKLKEFATNLEVDEGFRQSITDFMLRVTLLEDRASRQDRPLTVGELKAVREEYAVLKRGGQNTAFSWDTVWDRGFSSKYGPLDWEPPVPPPPDGGWHPYIRDIVDGDTLVVSGTRGPGIFMNQEGMTKSHKVRIIGVMSPEMNTAEGRRSLAEFEQTIYSAVARGDMITLVNDPDNFGLTDPYGRELAWLYIGDEPYYNPETLRPGGR